MWFSRHTGTRESTSSATRASKCPARDAAAAEAREVRARHLAVDQRNVARAALGDEARERDLGRVGRAREHRLAEEHAAESYAVEPADQLPAVPGLERMGEPAPVQEHVGLVHLARDPRARHAAPRPGAGLDHRRERRVDARLVAAPADRAPEAARDPELVGQEHGAGIRRPPQDRLLGREPGKYAATVGVDQPLGRQCPADGKQAVGLGERARRRRQGRRRVSLLKPGDSGHRLRA